MVAVERPVATTTSTTVGAEALKAQWKAEDKKEIRRSSIVWFNLAFLVQVHIGAAYALWLCGTSATWQTLALWPVLWYVSGLGITAGAHRLFAHKAYTASTPLRVFLMLANSMAYQGPLFEWARDHRTHHKCSETDGDPHDARKGFWFAHIGWVYHRKNPEVFRQGKMIDVSDLLADPVVMFQQRHYLKTVFVMCYLVPTLLGACWGDAYNAFWIGGVLRHVWVLHMTWFVNSAAHLWGSRPYNNRINPAESIWVSIGAIGEGWHNYHHSIPYDYSTSEHGFLGQWNPTTFFIDVAAGLGLVSHRRKASPALVAQFKAKTAERIAKGEPEHFIPLEPEVDTLRYD